MENNSNQSEKLTISDDIELIDPSIVDTDELITEAESIMDQANGSAESQSKALDEIVDLLKDVADEGTRELLIDKLSKEFDGVTKKILRLKLKGSPKNGSRVKFGSDDDILDDFPEGADRKLFMKYGFYELDNKLYFRTERGIKQGANFTLKPLFHVKGHTDAKRLFHIMNESGESETIELLQKDLTSLQAFKLRVESLGNFIWMLGYAELNKLKRHLYDKTESCQEIFQLGHQKAGFWAWSNGVFTDKFQPVSEYGIIRYRNKSYYIPALSEFYKDEASLYVNEKKFVYTAGKISMSELLNLIRKVFGDNGLIGFTYLLASCFRDIIVSKHNYFPLMNIFGPKSTGKTELANCLLHFFGKANPGPNINNTTKPALADHVARFRNALCHIDEYKNNLDFEKIEFLKGLWDGTGRSRMNMDKDKKMETTSVDSGVIITGQEMPTADIALFSRLIFLTFHRTDFSDEEKQHFNRLKETAKEGLTHLTHDILSHREFVRENFFDHYDKASKELVLKLSGESITDRIFSNWTIILAIYSTLKEKLSLPVEYEEVLDIVLDLMRRQNAETDRSDPVAAFWEAFNYLVKEGELKEEVDFQIQKTPELKTTKDDFQWDEPRDVLYINHTRVFDKYRRHGAQTRDYVLPKKTLEHYLKHSKEYLGRVKSRRFKMHHNSADDFITTSKEQVTTATAFSYSRLVDKYDISVISSLGDGDDIAQD